MSVRDAATVIVVRCRGDGYEMLLTRRPDSMKFMGGNWVFPGGACDDGDEFAPSTLDSNEAMQRLGDLSSDPASALRLHVAGVREVFEEVGILLALDQSGHPVDPRVVSDDYVPRREQITADFASFLRSEGLVASTDALVVHGRLVTPAMSPIRFDARFFVAEMPTGQRVHAHVGEVAGVMWASPDDVVQAVRSGSLDVPLPTMAVIQGLASIGSLQELLTPGRRTPRIASIDLSDAVSSVLAPNPGLMTGPGTNTYVIGTNGCLIVDPAVDEPGFIATVAQKVNDRGRVSGVVLTHGHPDHVGGADELSKKFGCPVYAHADVEWPGAQLVTDGQVFSAGEVEVRILHTPGHARGHICLHLPSESAVLAGDVIAGIGTVVIAPPDGNMADYMDTLRRLRSLNLRRIYPAHGPIVTNPNARLDEYIAHRMQREASIVEAVLMGAGTLERIVESVYSDIDPALRPVAEMSVRAHLEKLVADGVVEDRTWS